MDMVPAASKKRECGPDPASNNVLTQCIYEGAVPKLVVESKKTGEEIIKSKVSEAKYHYQGTINDGQVAEEEEEKGSSKILRTVHLKWTAKDSRLCQVTFPQNSSIVVLKLDGYDEPEEGYESESFINASQAGMMSFKREYDQAWDLQVVYEVVDKKAPPLEGILSCLYDEWDSEQIPAFTDMRSHLPEWALLGGGKGPGLLTIQKKVVV